MAKEERKSAEERRYNVVEVTGGVAIWPSLQGTGLTLSEALEVAEGLRGYLTAKHGEGYKVEVVR